MDSSTINTSAEECAICYCLLSQGTVVVLTCGHEYHKACFDAYASSKSRYEIAKCPYCDQGTIPPDTDRQRATPGTTARISPPVIHEARASASKHIPRDENVGFIRKLLIGCFGAHMRGKRRRTDE